MNSTEILRELGLTDEQIIEKIVDRVADSLMQRQVTDEYGDRIVVDSDFKSRLDAMIQERIDQAEARREEGKPMRQVTEQNREEWVHSAVAEAFELLREAR